MQYNYQKIKTEVEKIVKEANYSVNNSFGDTAWNYHILPVVKHSLNLGKIFNADLEVLELSAILHDYAAILKLDFYKEHHKHGARLAKDILTDLNYPEDKILLVRECILNHRGSVVNNKNSIEEKIVASADAMSHVSELADMFFLTFGVHKYKTYEGSIWLKNKLERSWNKIELKEGREIVKKDYEIAKYLLARAIERE